MRHKNGTCFESISLNRSLVIFGDVVRRSNLTGKAPQGDIQRGTKHSQNGCSMVFVINVSTSFDGKKSS